MASLSYVSSESAREVHVLRLRALFDRASLAPSLRFALSIVKTMREIQELADGYWYPTPIRYVPIGNTTLIIASTDTQELSRHFGGIRRAGYARYLSAKENNLFPTQDAMDWMGSETENSIEWTRNLLRTSIDLMNPTVNPPNIEFFGLGKVSTENVKGTASIWVRDFRSAVFTDTQCVLCRTRLGATYYRYFFGHVRDGRVIRETHLPGDLNRLQHGVAAIVGRPLTVRHENSDDLAMIHFFSPLPLPERRLLLALGQRDMSRNGKAYGVRNADHLTTLLGILRRLGCEIGQI
jgi:hypothetical protein